MQDIEYKRYEKIGNWDFSDIKYITKQESEWDFYQIIKNITNPTSLLLDLGTDNRIMHTIKQAKVNREVRVDSRLS